MARALGTSAAFRWLLVGQVGEIDLTRLSTDKLNRLIARLRLFRVDPDDGWEAIRIVNGLVIPVSEDVYAVDGDDELSAAISAAAAQVQAEIERRMSPERVATWKRVNRSARESAWKQEQRLGRRRVGLGWLRTLAPRRTNRRTPHPRRTARACSGPPSRDGRSNARRRCR